MDPKGSNATSYTCELSSFYSNYSKIHGWISLPVCIFGSIANILNILVLTRREMRSPTNAILTGLAVADLLVMIDYIPYVIHLYLYRRSRKDTFTYGWAVFVFFHSIFAQACHTISICLTLLLALWRYVAVSRDFQKNSEWCNYRRTIFAILAAYVFCPVLCVPLYITTEVTKKEKIVDSRGMSVNLTSGGNSTLSESALNGTTNITLYFAQLTETNLNLWIYSVVIKLLPCIVLTVFSVKLLQVLLEAKRRKRKLTSAQEECFERTGRRPGCRRHDKRRQTDRTTLMFLTVLLLFLMTEMPQGILGLLSVLLGRGFFQTCYLMLGDMIDILTLVNSAINFILYCAMSRKFRETFDELFCKGWRSQQVTRKQILTENNGNTGTTYTQVTQV